MIHPDGLVLIRQRAVARVLSTLGLQEETTARRQRMHLVKVGVATVATGQTDRGVATAAAVAVVLKIAILLGGVVVLEDHMDITRGGIQGQVLTGMDNKHLHLAL